MGWRRYARALYTVDCDTRFLEMPANNQVISIEFIASKWDSLLMCVKATYYGSQGDPNGAEFYGHRWISFPGITGCTMWAGQIYYTVPSAPDDTENYAYGGQIGLVDYGFDEFIMSFKGHVAQHSSDGGETWKGSIHRGHPVQDAELGNYFSKGWSR